MHPANCYWRKRRSEGVRFIVIRVARPCNIADSVALYLCWQYQIDFRDVAPQSSGRVDRKGSAFAVAVTASTGGRAIRFAEPHLLRPEMLSSCTP